MSRYDVVVVGARPAGAATAMLLARAGLRVALLDRGRYGSDTVSTHALMRAGVLQLSRWGLLDEIAASSTPPVRRTTFHYPGEDPVRISLRPSVGVDALYAPRRRLLDRVLVDGAARAGADVAHETGVTGLLRDHTGRVTGVRAVGPRGSLELSARLVVGADGIGSRVAREVDAPVLRRGRAASAVRYAYLAGVGAEGYEWAYGDGAAAGLIPTGDGLVCVFAATTPERLRTLARATTTDQVLPTLLHRAAPALRATLEEGRQVGRVHGWGGVRGFVRRSWGPGWALVGDAAYFKDPISTHGITDALRDADLLVDAILERETGVPDHVALGRYVRRRDALSASLFEVSDAIAAYDWRGSEVQPLLRRLTASMTDEVELLEQRPGWPQGWSQARRPATADAGARPR